MSSILDTAPNVKMVAVIRSNEECALPSQDGADYVTDDFNIVIELLQNISKERTKKMQILDTSAQSRHQVHSYTKCGVVRLA
jgi:hypothetical protein